NALPLPTDSNGNIVDVKGNLILDTSGNPVKSKEFNNNSSNVPTSVSSAPENKDAPQPKRVSDDILGMPKNVAIGLGVVLLAVGGYFLYKKVINKSI
ncbi:MAG: hypothetical protein IPJ01_11985, partial [Micavibrio sp.]|nr:hypothetical protein [Micavibrio sp.]